MSRDVGTVYVLYVSLPGQAGPGHGLLCLHIISVPRLPKLSTLLYTAISADRYCICIHLQIIVPLFHYWCVNLLLYIRYST